MEKWQFIYMLSTSFSTKNWCWLHFLSFTSINVTISKQLDSNQGLRKIWKHISHVCHFQANIGLLAPVVTLIHTNGCKTYLNVFEWNNNQIQNGHTMHVFLIIATNTQNILVIIDKTIVNRKICGIFTLMGILGNMYKIGLHVVPTPFYTQLKCM